MTCIVGYLDKEKIYVGADSAGVAVGRHYLQVQTRKDTKVFHIDGPRNDGSKMLIGYTSSFRMGQILRFGFTPPPHPPDVDVYQYMCTDFVDALINIFTDKKFATKENEQLSGGTFLIGYLGRLFSVLDDFQVEELVRPYATAGSGAMVALGALYALEGSKKAPAKKIEIALRAAEEFTGGVRGPFTVLELEK